MYETVVVHVTKSGYDAIAKKLAGEIEDLKITSIAFGGGLSPASLTPYNPSIDDTAIPNELFRINEFDVVYDVTDGLLTLMVEVPRDLAGDYYLNAVGVYVNDNILFAANSLALLKVDTGSEVILAIKIPFIPDTAIDLVAQVAPTPEQRTWSVESFFDRVSNGLIPAGQEGVFYNLTLNNSSLYAYLTIEVESLNPLYIDYIAIAPESADYYSVVLVRDITLDTASMPRLSIKIPAPFKQLVVANKKSGDDTFYNLDVYGIKLR